MNTKLTEAFSIKNNSINLDKILNLSEFEKVIRLYPNHSWNWEWLIQNTDYNVEEYIPFNLIEKYPYKWDYYKLSYNPNITKEFILKYPYKNWDIDYLIENNKITNFKDLINFKNITENIIKKYPNKSWDWEWIIENTDIELEKYISLDLIKKYLYKWDYYKLTYNQNLTEEFILEYPYQHWDIIYLIENNKITDFNELSRFKYINEDIIKKYPNKLWDWEWLIEKNFINIYLYIPIEIIKKYKNKWNYYVLSKNPNLTEEFILEYPYKNWNIKYLIDNNKITDFKSLSKFKYLYRCSISNYPNKPWDWEWLFENTNFEIEKYIPMEIVYNSPFKKYKYWALSKNPNLVEAFILKNPNKCWDIEYLIENNKITDFKALSKFKYINYYIINKYPYKNWDKEWLIENTDFLIV